MSRYYIDTADDATFDMDEEGQDLPSHQALHALIRRTLGAMVKHDTRHRPETTFSAIVRDEGGRTVLTGHIRITIVGEE
jgi:hypothetical protein